MKRILITVVAIVTLLTLAVCAGAGWYFYGKQPVRKGNLTLNNLQALVTVRYDERGVPHIAAENEADMYRALGYVQAQDRLFQMEILRRLANGELSEILGTKLLKTDKLFRTLGLQRYAQAQAAALDPAKPSTKALQAYLDGVNQYQASHRPPVEFDILRIPKRPFQMADGLAVNAYFAYSFAAAFQTVPLLTFIRDKLGPDYLAAFDTDWHPEGPVRALLSEGDYGALQQLAQTSHEASELSGVPAFQGSNAWVVAGKHTASGKPLLAGDPHIGFSAPAVWYEAQLSCPGFDLYGHFTALNPFALLGFNKQFGWSLTLFENADIDLVAEKVNPGNANQVWEKAKDQWADLTVRSETIHVKSRPDVQFDVRQSVHGPIITDAVETGLGSSLSSTPIAMWWTYQQAENVLPDAFYALNRASTLDLAREAVSQIHAPGLNILWASAAGDIAWWAAAKLPQRPIGVNPLFILDAAKGEADKLGFYNFTFNPQEENPARGYIASANQQPISAIPVPGYYRLPDRFIEIDRTLQDPKQRWTTADAKKLQLDDCNGYPRRILRELVPVLDQVLTDPNDRAFLEPLKNWDGCYDAGNVAPTLFTQFTYELAHALFADKLSEKQFADLLDTAALDQALPRIAADVNSPWWDNKSTSQKESRYETVRLAWSASLRHLEKLYGTSLLNWTWGHTHTLTHHHPLGQQVPLNWLFDVGPLVVTGGRDVPDNFSQAVGPGPWSATYGPSTRRIIDFAKPQSALGIGPLGQSGIPFDRHYADQAEKFALGGYSIMHTDEADVQRQTRSTLVLRPPSGASQTTQ